MTKADSAQVSWDAEKKHWVVRLQIGEEVVKRPCSKTRGTHDLDDEALRNLAVTTANDDGYALDLANISIAR